jgi:hypothetical protein
MYLPAAVPVPGNHRAQGTDVLAVRFPTALQLSFFSLKQQNDLSQPGLSGQAFQLLDRDHAEEIV